ncbi:MAG: hypothetical protein IBX67_03750 [Dehalococcoidia bacterium]|nr:hypothetical protein [Dehalococcoidia bacterium]
MRKGIALAAALVVLGLCAAPVAAQSLQVSPSSVQLDVPAEGSSEVEFYVFNFAGDLEISLEDIPLTVSPETVSVNATGGSSRVVLTLYGDETSGTETYRGYIRFLSRTGGMVATGIKVRATVNHMAEDEPSPAMSLYLIICIAVAVVVAAGLVVRSRRRSRRALA